MTILKSYASLAPTPRPPQEAYPHFRTFCLEHAEAIRQLVTTQRAQTNEVQRCQPQLELYTYTPNQVQHQLLAYYESHGRWLEWLLSEDL